MTQTQLNYMMVKHIHKHLTDFIDYTTILNEFVSANEGRLAHFGKFYTGFHDIINLYFH